MTSLAAGRRTRPAGSPLVVALTVALSVLAAYSGAATWARPAAAAGPVDYYVDGKTGSDADDGRSPATAFKTIEKALETKREPGTIRVHGYTDYVYQESIERSWYLPGTSTDPVVIEPYDYQAGTYVRPIVSGGIDVTGPWSRPDPVNYPHVYATAWSTPIPGYDSAVRSLREERLYLDVSQPLVRPATDPTLAELEATPASQYWNGTTLYVRLGAWSGTPSSYHPADHKITVPTYHGICAGTGSAYVTVRGFRVRHTVMGVGFTGNAHHNTVSNTDASYNYRMGFFTASNDNLFERLSGTRNTIQLVKLDNGAQHNIVRNVTGYQNLGQGIKITGANTFDNQVRHSAFGQTSSIPAAARQYGGQTQGVDIEQGAHDNLVTNVKITDNPRGVMLYQLDGSGQALDGNRFQYLWLERNTFGVFVWDGRSGADSSGSVGFYRNTYVDSQVAIMVEGATSGKTFDHETIYDAGSSPVENHSAVYLKGGSVTLTNSLVDRTSGYAVRALAGSSASVLTSNVFRSGLGDFSGNVTTDAGLLAVDPIYQSESRTSPSFLKLDALSPLHGKASDGKPLGSRY